MVREEVHDFAEAMEKVLKENDDKEGWEECSNLYLVQRLVEETSELLKMMDAGELDDMCKEAVDVANFAMMIFDNNKDQMEAE